MVKRAYYEIGLSLYTELGVVVSNADVERITRKHFVCAEKEASATRTLEIVAGIRNRAASRGNTTTSRALLAAASRIEREYLADEQEDSDE